MCAIIDNDVVHQLFGDRPTEAGLYFLRWLGRGNGGVVVVGGRLFRELSQNPKFVRFFTDRLQAGRARRIPDGDVSAAEEAIRAASTCRSNDVHVLALAHTSGARLLFTNDRALQRDFADPEIIDGTRGRIYTTVERSDVRRSHVDLLRRTDLCEG